MSKMPTIERFMKENKLRGRPNKYAILISANPPTLMSREKTYRVENVDWSNLKLPIIVHKKRLREFMSAEQAKVFWTHGIPTRR